MIVKCEQCQTRFKIPDEKVTDKGVKVRCTKCGHTFRVTRESAASAQGSPATLPPVPLPGPVEGGFDPFERFGTPAAPPPPAPWNSADSGVHDEIHEETTRVMPFQVPVEARPPVPSLPPLPFDLPPATAPASAARGAPPASQGLPGPGAVSFRPAAPAGGVPGVPSVAPSVSPVASRGNPTPPPVKSAGAAAQKPPAGAAPRPLAPPAVPVPTAAAPARRPSRPVAAVPAPAPAPAPAPGGADLFTEFFANPAGGSLPPAPLPDLPPPGLPPVSAAPAPAPSRPAAASHPFAPPDDNPFGALSGDLSEPSPDLGPAPDFDPTAMFSDPEPAAPPMPPAVARPVPMPAPPPPAPAVARPLPVPPTPAPQPMGRPLAAPPTPAPGRLAPSPAVAMATAPAARLAPSPMFPPSPPAPPPAPAPLTIPDDPFGPSNADLSEPSPEFGFGADPEPAPAAAPAPAPLTIPDDPFGSSGVDLSGGGEEHAAAAPSPYAAPAPMPAAPGMDEFGPSFGGPSAPAQAAPAPAPAFAPPGPMDFGMIGDDQMPAEPDAFGAPAPAAGMADPFAPPAPAAGMADPFAAPQGMADPFAAQGQAPGIPDPFAAQASGPGMADPFAAQAQGSGNPDPFASAEPDFSPTTTGRQMLGTGSPSEGFLTQTDTSHQTISPTDTGRQMLDLPQHASPEPGPGEEFGAPASRELIDLPSQPEAPAPAARPVPTLASPAIARPAGRPADMGIPERRKPTAAQQVTGQVAYLTIAAGLLLALTAVGGVYMKEGKVDAAALSPGHLMQLLTPSDFAASNVTNGLYDTRGGGSVFYVRGEVENRASKPARIKVQAALYDGDQRVKSTEGLAGKVPTPEELNAVTTAEAAAQLRSQLDAGATVVPPGGKAPFLVVFQEYPQELSAFRLQVSMEPAPEEGSKP